MSYKKILLDSNKEGKRIESVESKNSDLGISSEKYIEIFNDVRETVLGGHNDKIVGLISDKKANKEKLIAYIEAALSEYKGDYSNILGRLYQDIFSFAFIDDLLEDEDLEEINGNAWNDIEIITAKGWKKIDKKFQSPEHAINVITSMMRVGGKILDDAQPSLDSHVGTGLRLTATISPVVDEDVGASFSLRKIQRGKINVDNLVNKYKSYSEEEINFIKDCLKHGVSVIFGGATSSGKTADLQAVCMELVEEGRDRIFTIEEDTRELNFITKDGNENINSRVIHTKTRPSENANAQKLNVDSEFLLKKALRYHPDIIVPSEMRGGEAFVAQEAARTGHAVASSVHVPSVTGSYERILTLCQQSGVNLTEDMLTKLIVDAFPICIFKMQLSEDKSRRCLKIFEATGYDKLQKRIKGRILYRFIKEEVIKENGFTKVVGKHIKVKDISLKLAQKLYENGMPLEKVNFYNSDFNPLDGEDHIEDYIED